jgi:hypothetical protein
MLCRGRARRRERRHCRTRRRRFEGRQTIRAVPVGTKSTRDRMRLVRYYRFEEDKEVTCRELKMMPPSFNVVPSLARSRFLDLLRKRAPGGSDLLASS